MYVIEYGVNLVQQKFIQRFLEELLYSEKLINKFFIYYRIFGLS